MLISYPDAKSLYISLLTLMHNESLNISEHDLRAFLTLVRMDGFNDTNNSSTVEEKLDCGGALEDMARSYTLYYHPYLAIAVCIFGTVANVLNIAVLTRKDMASAPINRILTALAVADMLVMIEYIPYTLYYYMILPKTMDFPYPAAVYMVFHTHISQLLHTTSICLTLTLAIWRYLAIGYPEKNHILCSEFRCTLAIGLSYLIPIVLCLPTYFTTTITTKEIMEDKLYTLYVVDLNELLKNDENLLMANFWVYAVFIKLLPCCILTVISCWLIRTLFKAKRRKQVLRGYDSHPLTVNGQAVKRKASKAERRADRTTKMLIAVLCLFLVTEFPQGIFALLIGIKGTYFFQRCYQVYGELMDILALLNGAINFILYCCMNRMFRATFGQLFKHKILAQWANNIPSEVHTTTVGNGTNTTEL